MCVCVCVCVCARARMHACKHVGKQLCMHACMHEFWREPCPIAVPHSPLVPSPSMCRSWSVTKNIPSQSHEHARTHRHTDTQTHTHTHTSTYVYASMHPCIHPYLPCVAPLARLVQWRAPLPSGQRHTNLARGRQVSARADTVGNQAQRLSFV